MAAKFSKITSNTVEMMSKDSVELSSAASKKSKPGFLKKCYNAIKNFIVSVYKKIKSLFSNNAKAEPPVQTTKEPVKTVKSPKTTEKKPVQDQQKPKVDVKKQKEVKEAEARIREKEIAAEKRKTEILTSKEIDAQAQKLPSEVRNCQNGWKKEYCDSHDNRIYTQIGKIDNMTYINRYTVGKEEIVKETIFDTSKTYEAQSFKGFKDVKLSTNSRDKEAVLEFIKDDKRYKVEFWQRNDYEPIYADVVEGGNRLGGNDEIRDMAFKLKSSIHRFCNPLDVLNFFK